jgi:hypothetical protein
MTEPLPKYFTRSPRYILQPDEDTLIRVAGPHQWPWEERTEIKDISLTGLAFTAPNDLTPLIGELIKIQFTVPGSVQTACFGLVSRLEPHGSQEMMVGVEFRKLEAAQRFILAQSLARKLRSQADFALRFKRSYFIKSFLLSFSRKEILLSAGAVIAWILAYTLVSHFAP